jgi:hypothetical protein
MKVHDNHPYLSRTHSRRAECTTCRAQQTFFLCILTEEYYVIAVRPVAVHVDVDANVVDRTGEHVGREKLQ